jgi:hypothetical protein
MHGPKDSGDNRWEHLMFSPEAVRKRDERAARKAAQEAAANAEKAAEEEALRRFRQEMSRILAKRGIA